MDLPRGMKDFENNEFSKIEFVREKFLETSEIFGFKLMEPSPIESLLHWKQKVVNQSRMIFIFSRIKVKERLH